jgi:hypothetical protein
MEAWALTAILTTLCIGLASCNRGKNSGERSSSSAPATPQQNQNQPQSMQKQRQDAERQVRPDIENERKDAQQQAEHSLDQEAVAAIEQTRKAIDAISANKTDEALADIEQATGKVNVLLGRNPAKALIPVSVEVDVIDAAPQDIPTIREIARDAGRAMDDKDFPTARVLLYALTSEIRIRTYHLPLATYPTALKEAARLLAEKKNQDAQNVLLEALNTLVAIDKVTPLPLVLARSAINAAQEQSQKDKNSAQTLLEVAKNQLERARELGYTGKDAEYKALNTDITNLEKQLKGNGDVSSVFTKLKERLAAFMKRQSDCARH